jgi:tyrosine-protein phosphatase YwqE
MTYRQKRARIQKLRRLAIRSMHSLALFIESFICRCAKRILSRQEAYNLGMLRQKIEHQEWERNAKKLVKDQLRKEGKIR